MPDEKPISVEGRQNVTVGRDNTGVIVSVDGAPARVALHVRAPIPDFVGREREVESLVATLRSGASVSICGVNGLGGIGKTELALVVADRLRDLYRDQLLVALRGSTGDPVSPEAALAECIRPFVPLEARLPDDLATLVHLYHQTLGGGGALVILDDAADSNHIEYLRPPRGCAMLVTSRETILLPGMRPITLEELPPDKARELLVEIAGPVDPATADLICRLCGYLPLAIRAAASALAVYGDLDPADYAAELGAERNRLKLLAPDRNLSVEASFGLSYKRLTADEARVFRRLAVFAPATSFEAKAVEEICEDEGHKSLSELLRRNLVIYEKAEKRYRLHDLARVFAEARLDEDEEERDEARLRHATYFQHLLSDVSDLYQKGGDKIVGSLALFDRERINIEAGQKWCAERMDSDQAAARLAKIYTSDGIYILVLRLLPRERIEWLNVEMRACRKLGDRSGEGVASGNLGRAYADLGETRQAIEYQEQALKIAREIEDRTNEGVWMRHLGQAYAALGETSKATGFYEQSLMIAQKIGYPSLEANNLSNWGDALVKLGETDRAGEMIEAALAIYEQIESPRAEQARKRLAELKGK
jgi:tetratricopeptide (TPR) repeat protein